MERGFRTHALTPRPGDYLHAGHGRGSQTRVHKATASTPTIAQEQTACIYRAVIFIQRGKKKKTGEVLYQNYKKNERKRFEIFAIFLSDVSMDTTGR